MKRSRILPALLGVLVALPLLLPATPALADGCIFTNGFKALHDAIPGIVGDCLGDEYGVAAGGTFQSTTNGTLMWWSVRGVEFDDSLPNGNLPAVSFSYAFGTEADCFVEPFLWPPYQPRYYGNGVCRSAAWNTANDGWTAACKDATVSYSSRRRGTCAGHGGVWQWNSSEYWHLRP